MKPISIKNEDVNNISGESRGKKAQLSTSSAHIFKLLAENYSDKVGSVVREITSNCFDAHIDAKITDKPIKVGFGKDDYNNEYVFFRDYGKGMTPEFMNNSYMIYGESSKRDSDDQIGMYGVGSKSPFSISNEYYIISIINGIKYTYIIFVGDDSYPEYDILSEVRTTELTGTEVRIFLGHEYDQYDFEHAFKNQLFYFRDVFFVNTTLNNNYNIIEFDNFVFRKDKNNNKIEACSEGRIRYKIDYDKLGIEWLYIPVGIKFPIGELTFDITRENISYNRREKNNILRRIKNTCYEILGRWNSQEFLIEDLKEFISKEKDITYKKLDFEVDVREISDYLYSNFDINIKPKTFKFKLFEDLEIYSYTSEDVIDIISLIFNIEGNIQSTRLYRKDIKFTKNYITKQLLNGNSEIYTVGKNFTSDINKNKYIVSGVLISPNRDYVKFYYNLKDYFFEKNKITKFRLQKARLLYKYFEKIILENTISYKKIEVPKEELEIILEEKRLNRNDSFIINVGKNNDYDFTRERFNTFDYFLDSYNNNYTDLRKKNTVIYFKDKKIAKYLFDYRILKNHNKISLCYVSNKNYELLKQENLKNFMPQEEFFNHKMFRKFCTAFYIQSLMNKHLKSNEAYIKLFNENIYFFNNELAEEYKELVKFVKDYTIKTNENYLLLSENLKIDEFKDDCISIGKIHNLIDKDKVLILNKIKSYFKGLELISFIDYEKIKTIEDQIIIVNYIKSIKKKVNNEWYNILCQNWEIQLIYESYEKSKYLKSLIQLKQVA